MTINLVLTLMVLTLGAIGILLVHGVIVNKGESWWMRLVKMIPATFAFSGLIYFCARLPPRSIHPNYIIASASMIIGGSCLWLIIDILHGQRERWWLQISKLFFACIFICMVILLASLLHVD